MDEIEWADEDGNFIMYDGFPGNPGCECGEYNAVVCIDGEYFCEGGYEDWLAEQE